MLPALVNDIDIFRIFEKGMYSDKQVSISYAMLIFGIGK